MCWEKIKFDYLHGKSVEELSQLYGVAKKTIYNKVSADKWNEQKRKLAEQIKDIEGTILNENKEHVQKVINKEIEIKQKELITKEQVLNDLILIKDRCMFDSENFNPNAALKACEMLGKYLGIFEKDNQQQASSINMMNTVKVAGKDLKLKIGKDPNDAGA